METTWSIEQKRLSRIGIGATVLGLLVLAVFSGAVAGRRSFEAVLFIEVALVAIPAVTFTIVRAQRWTQAHDLLSPLVALPIAYVFWFTLGSIDWIEVPSHWLFGFFDPIPGRMWFYYALGLGGFLAGGWLANRRTIPRQPAQSVWDPRRSRVLLSLLFAVMVLSWIVLIAQFGIPGRNANASEARLTVHGPFYLLFVSSAWTFFLFLPMHGWIRQTRRSTLATTSLLLVTGLLLASLAGRSNIFVPLLTLLIVKHYAGKRLDLRSSIALGLAGLIGVGLFGYLRDTAESDRSLLWMQAVGIPEPLIPAATAAVYVRYSIATFRDVTEMIPSHVPYQYGAQTLAPFKTFLPGRQEMSDIFFREMLGNDFVGAGEPATMLGPLYADFGGLGVFVGMLLFGSLLSCLYRRMRENPDPFRILIYAWVLQSGLFGLFATIFPYITTLLLPLFWYGLHRILRAPVAAESMG